MPAKYGYLDPLEPIGPLPGDPIDDPIKDPRNNLFEDPIDLPLDPPIEIPPGLIGNNSEFTMGAMPSLNFGNSVLVSYV